MSKKKILIGVGVGVVFAGIVASVATFLLNYKRPADTKKVDINYTENGLKYTHKDYIVPMMSGSTQKIKLMETCKFSPNTITLNLEDNKFIDVKIPDDIDHMADTKTVYATNGEYSLVLVKNNGNAELSNLAGILKPASTSSGAITDMKESGYRTVAYLIPETQYALIANVSSNSDVYTFFCNYLGTCNEVKEIHEPEWVENVNQLDSLSYTGIFAPSIDMQKISIEQKRFLFEEGYLTYQSMPLNIKDVKKDSLITVNVQSGLSIDTYYENNGIVYASASDNCLGLFSYNSNTTIILTGKGEEAKCNIISILSALNKTP